MPIKSPLNAPLPSRVAYTINEAIYIFNIGRTKLYDEINAGRIKTVKIGAKTLIPATEPEKWLERLESADA